MRIISRKKIIDFYSRHASSKTALEIWYHKVCKCSWENLNEVKKDFSSADNVGNNRVVFDVKGNTLRVVTIVIYVSQKVYIRWIGTHTEYDKIDPKYL